MHARIRMREMVIHARGEIKPVGSQSAMRRSTASLALLCVAQFIDVLGVTVAIVALPSIARALDAEPSTSGWVISAYALSFGGLLLAGGRLADLLGRRRVFVGGLLAFALASLACGLATSAAMLIAARVAQGAAAAAVVPAALALLSDTFPGGAQRTRAVAIWTAAAAGGGASGFFLGGVVTGALGWRWVFLLNVPIALAAAALAPRLLAESRAKRKRVRLRRALAASAGPAAVAAVLTATTGGAAVLATAYLQDVLERSPASAGFVFVPFSLAVVAGSVIGPRIVERAGRTATIALGLAAVAAGLLVPAIASSDSAGLGALLAGLAISGAGLGLASVAATSAGMASAAADEQGLVAGLLNTATQLGTAVGVASLGALAAAVTAAADSGTGDKELVTGYHAGWLAAAALAGAGALVAATLSRRGARAGAPPGRQARGRR